MLTTTKSLLDLTAFDLMSREVVTIPRQMSLNAAAHLLARAEISGAPVVDDDGHCIGMLSSTDVMHWVDREAPSHREAPDDPADCMCCEWEMVDRRDLPRDAVSRFMTPQVVTAGPDVRIGKLAGSMLDAHIHRIVIADEKGRPVGVVSTTDILAAVAREEAMTGEPTDCSP